MPHQVKFGTVWSKLLTTDQSLTCLASPILHVVLVHGIKSLAHVNHRLNFYISFSLSPEPACRCPSGFAESRVDTLLELRKIILNRILQKSLRGLFAFTGRADGEHPQRFFDMTDISILAAEWDVAATVSLCPHPKCSFEINSNQAFITLIL